MRRIVSILFISIIIASLTISGYQVFAQDEESQEPIKVVTKEIEPFVFVAGENGNYGIVFPEGSPLREGINRALLRLAENGIYDQIYEKWYGVVFD